MRDTQARDEARREVHRIESDDKQQHKHTVGLSEDEDDVNGGGRTGDNHSARVQRPLLLPLLVIRLELSEQSGRGGRRRKPRGGR